MTTGPAAEVRRTGPWRWAVTLTGVRTHARPRTVTGPAWWARRRAAAILGRAAGGDRPPDYVVRLAARPRLEPGHAAAVLDGYAAAGFAGPYPVEPRGGGPVNLYRSHLPGWTEPVRVIGPDGETAWEGTGYHSPDGPDGEIVAVWPAGPPGEGHYHVSFGDPGAGFIP